MAVNRWQRNVERVEDQEQISDQQADPQALPHQEPGKDHQGITGTGSGRFQRNEPPDTDRLVAAHLWGADAQQDPHKSPGSSVESVVIEYIHGVPGWPAGRG